MLSSVLMVGVGCIPQNKKGVSITYEALDDGHVTIAVNDADGRRVRNLVADFEVKKGSHELAWDGRSDDGSLAPPGEYKWTGLIRGKLDVLYRGTWQEGNPPWLYGRTGGWLSDHYPPCAVACLADRVFVGAGISEYGRGVSCVDMNGKVVWADRWLANNFIPWNGAACLKTDGERVFAMGFPNGVPGFHTIVEIDPGNGNSWPVVRISNPKPGQNVADIPIHRQWVIKDRDDERLKDVKGLRLVGARRIGATRWDGELYASDILGGSPRTFVYSTGRAPEASPDSESGYYNGGDNEKYMKSLRNGSGMYYHMRLLRVLPLRIWDMAWLPDGRCLAVLDKSVAVLDTETGTATPLVTSGVEAPFAIAVDGKGRIYVSDRGGHDQLPASTIYTLPDLPHLGMRLSDKSSQQVKIFDSSGKLLRVMGREGGRRFGPIDPRDFHLPAGLGVDARGRLWVTEESYPKRVSVWEIPDDPIAKEPVLAKEFFSSAEYGEAGYMPDPKNPRHIIAETSGVLWDVDIAKGSFHPIRLLPRIAGATAIGREGGIRYSMSHDPDFPFPLPLWAATVSPSDSAISFQNAVSFEGRRFVWSSTPYEMVSAICEESNDMFKPLAAFGAVGGYAKISGLHGDQWIPKAILDAAKRHPQWAELAKRHGLDPAMTDFPHDPKKINWPREIDAFNWTDANGDGRMQSDEITLGANPGKLIKLDERLDAIVSVNGNLWRMRHGGFSGCGAPVYDWAKAEPLFNRSPGLPSFIGADGEILVTPREGYYRDIRYVGSDGRLRWSYPTFFPEHGHRSVPNLKEKIMAPGTIYGSWNMQGVAGLPDGSGRFFLLHGGHGMNYLMTLEDGLFIGTVFKPQCVSPTWDEIPGATLGMSLNEHSLNEECFNGSMVRVEKSEAGFEAGHYYLLGNHRSSVVELTGLETVKRLPGGTVNLTGKMVDAIRGEELLSAMEAWKGEYAGTSFDIARVDAGVPKPSSDGSSWIDFKKLGRNKLVNFKAVEGAVGGYFNGQDNARAILWHNPKGMGIGINFGQIHGGSPDHVFVNEAPAWEQCILYGDAMEMDIASDLADVAAIADPRRLVFARWQGKPIGIQYRKVKSAAVPSEAKILQEKPFADGTVWIAERLDIPDIKVFVQYDQPNPASPQDLALLTYVMPWEKLGLVWAENMKLRMNIILIRREPAGGGVRRIAWMKDGTDCVTDMMSALERPAALWRSCILRPTDYVFPPHAPESESGTAKKDAFVIAAEGNPENKPAIFADATVWLASTPEALKMKWYVTKDSSPFVNNGKGQTLLFKTGDACDLQIESPKLGKCRYLITMCDGAPIVMRYRYDAKDAGEGEGVWYRSPVGEFFVPSVERLPIGPKVHRGDTWYTVELAIPWGTLGIDPKPGIRTKFELGVLRSDGPGATTISRDYWNSGLSGMTQDVPTEAKSTENWGEAVIRNIQ